MSSIQLDHISEVFIREELYLQFNCEVIFINVSRTNILARFLSLLLEENSSTSENIRNQWRTQTTTSDCLAQTERHKPVSQTESSSEKVRQESRVVQTVPSKELNSHSNKETSQSSKYQVTDLIRN